MKQKYIKIGFYLIAIFTIFAGATNFNDAHALTPGNQIQANNAPANNANSAPANNPQATYVGRGVESSIRALLCAPSDSGSATTTGTGSSIPGLNSNATVTTNPAGNDLTNCINRGYKFALAFGAVAAVFFVVIAGYMYMVGGEKGKEEAKSVLLSVIVGFLIMLSSFVLLKQINPTLVAFRTIQPPQLQGIYVIPGCEDAGLGVDCAAEFVSEVDIPPSSGCQKKFDSEAQARVNMATFPVNIWGPGKVSKQVSVTVQKCLQAKVQGLFQQLYNDPEKFPIKTIGSFSWRKAANSDKISMHSFGLTFDINYEENYFIGRGQVGKYWKPCPAAGCDQYSMPRDGSVVRAFKAAGYGWGGDWRSIKDYMHFSCAPSEQGHCF